MKFDFVVGNPPYQDTTLGDNAAYARLYTICSWSRSDRVERIHPARSLFNAGRTPKNRNRKMLFDSHFRIPFYEQDRSRVFSNADIKGGVAISYRDAVKDYGAIESMLSTQLSGDLTCSKLYEYGKSISEQLCEQERFRITDAYPFFRQSTEFATNTEWIFPENSKNGFPRGES